MKPPSQANPAAYAVRDDRSAGRGHPEPHDPIASPFQRDRRRVVHSTAFRRLEYKTQVFVTHEHDHFRTRLTHTLEVTEIARRLAVALRVNQTLTETVALAHDLGHAPFGHAGEATLNDLLRDHGGFEHNAHSLRIVDYLEHPFPPFRGLNLSFEVREGLAKHHTLYDRPKAASADAPATADLLAAGPYPSVEGQIASLADRLAYDCHDLEDALGAGLIAEADLAPVTLWSQAADPIRQEHADLPLAAVRRPILDALLDNLLDDTTGETTRRLQSAGIASVDDARRASTAMVALSGEAEALLSQLETFLLHRVYRHQRLVQMDAEARRVVTDVFNAYLRDPDALPQRFAARIGDFGPHRVVCDYVAGMTDRFCRQQRESLASPRGRR
ncbi:MAG: deoxyguanosinetriphosphate triphosphohydrolase [Planctomycetota bacterium]